MNWKIGDVVCLKSGGPVMTVNDMDGEYLSCVWIENGHLCDADQIHPDALCGADLEPLVGDYSAELSELRANSWEWEALVPALNDEALIGRFEHALANCETKKTRPFTVYDDAVKGLYAPELLNRFKERTTPKNRCQACNTEAEIGTEGNPHPVPKRFHTCVAQSQSDSEHPHIVEGEFQSDKYPGCPPGKVPLSTKDPMAQDLLWLYAKRRRLVDEEFANDLEFALRAKGYDGTIQGPSRFGLGIFIEEPQAAPRDKDGTFLCFNCRKSPAVGMSCGGPVCTSCAHDLPFTSFPLNGLLCPVCKLPQRNTSGGSSCENGHGGEIGVEP